MTRKSSEYILSSEISSFQKIKSAMGPAQLYERVYGPAPN